MKDALLAWDGETASASELRARFAELPLSRGRVDPGERGMAKLRRALDGGGEASSFVGWLARNPDELPPLAPLLGDPALAPWPWEDPFTIDDDLALAALAVLESARLVVTPAMRRFMRVLLRVRPRQIWTAAARAMARQACTDTELADHVQRLWTRAFADGIALGGANTRLRRHALFLGCAWVAAGGALEGVDPRTLASRKLPRDDADRSVVLQSLLAMASIPEVAEALPKLLVDRKHGPLAERVLVDSWDAIPTALHAPLSEVLARPRWNSVDGLLTWMHTVRTLELEVPDPGLAVGALALAREPRGSAEELVGRLQRALDPVRSRLVPDRERAVVLCEAVAMLDAPAVADLEWPLIAEVVGPWLVPVPGTVGEVGLTAIGTASAEAGRPLQHLLRSGTLSQAAVFRISGSDNGFVATQVAVQIEAALRQAADDSERLRILWRLLQTDPPSRTFTELQDMLRADADPGDAGEGLLIDVARSVAELYRQRQAEDPAALAAAMRDLAEHIDRMEASHRPPLRSLARLVECEGADCISVLPDLLGDDERGLLPWTHWVREVPASERAEELIHAATALADLRAAIVNLESARPLIEASHGVEVRRTTEAVLRLLANAGWPERHAVAFVLGRLTDGTAHDLRVGHRARAAARELADAMDLGREELVLARLADPAFVELLTTDQLQEAHRFLLDQMAWWEAGALRERVARRVHLPSVFVHFVPLCIAIFGGALFVQDFGGGWMGNDGGAESVVEANEVRMHFGLTVVLATILAYLTLTVTVARRFTSDSGGPYPWGTVVVRSTPIFLAGLVLAASANGLVLGTLNKLDAEKAVVGGLLTLFLGVFVGLVLPSNGRDRD